MKKTIKSPLIQRWTLAQIEERIDDILYFELDTDYSGQIHGRPEALTKIMALISSLGEE